MDYRRKSDLKVHTRITDMLKRIWIDIFVLLTMFGLSFLLPDTPEEAKRAGSQLNLMAMFITKTNSILWPWLITDVVRKWKYPYLDLQKMVKEGQWSGVVFLTVIYFVVIYAFAVGG